jgi:predicted transcriptional regulator of viral defense system
MGGVQQRGEVAQLAAAQWGLVTTAQAHAVGLPRMLLSRMVASGELERVVHGVYATPSAATDHLVELRALWLSLDPVRSAEERLRERCSTGVLSHATAASLHQIGDLLDTWVEVTLPSRYQGRRDRIRAHRAMLEPADVTLVEGLPVTTAARTVADLVVDRHDRDHVATVMTDALRGGLTGIADVARALKQRLGDGGQPVLEELVAASGQDW